MDPPKTKEPEKNQNGGLFDKNKGPLASILERRDSGTGIGLRVKSEVTPTETSNDVGPLSLGE